MSEEKQETKANSEPPRKRSRLKFFGVVLIAVLATLFGLALRVNIFQRKQEARNPFFRVVELTDDTTDPAVWGKNFPLQYDDYLKTVDQVARATVAATRCHGPRPRLIRVRSSPNHGSKKIRA